MNYNNECNFPFAATAKGINISSGYRGPELNTAVGGSSTSAHCHGYAFDLVPTLLPHIPCRQSLRPVDFRKRKRSGCTQLDACGLQAS